MVWQLKRWRALQIAPAIEHLGVMLGQHSATCQYQQARPKYIHRLGKISASMESLAQNITNYMSRIASVAGVARIAGVVRMARIACAARVVHVAHAVCVCVAGLVDKEGEFASSLGVVDWGLELLERVGSPGV